MAFSLAFLISCIQEVYVNKYFEGIFGYYWLGFNYLQYNNLRWRIKSSIAPIQIDCLFKVSACDLVLAALYFNTLPIFISADSKLYGYSKGPLLIASALHK